MIWVVESTLRAFGLPESVNVLFDRSKLWTWPWSALKWPLVELDMSLADVEPGELPVLP